MQLYEILLTAVALSMDAFAVAMCKGLSVRSLKIRHTVIVGLYFGVFQALMPLIGYLLGSTFSGYVESFSSWIAFALLAFIGGNMIKESTECECCNETDDSFAVGRMLTLAVATSIDALAAGIAISMNPPVCGIWVTVLLIGITTFILSAIGVKIGGIFGARYKARAELFGGIVLIGIGVKMVVEHLFFG